MNRTPAPTGLVIAVEPMRDGGATVVVETDERLRVVVSRESAADRRVTERRTLGPDAWAALMREYDGADSLLARRVVVSTLLPPTGGTL